MEKRRMELTITTRNGNSLSKQQPTLPITTRRNLVKVRQSVTYNALSAGKFNWITEGIGNSVKALLDRPNIVMITKLIDPTVPEMFIAAEITKLISIVNVDQRLNIAAEQVPFIASQLMDRYKTESLEDFVLCFRRGGAGFYGAIYRLDAAVLNEWMQKYLDEKYTYVEAQVTEIKEETAKQNEINYEAFKERVAEFIKPDSRLSSFKENEIQR